MKQFRSFIRKEFLHILRDRRTMLIVLCMPIVQIVLFGFAITNEVKDARVAVLDLSQDVETQRIKQRIEASTYFSLIDELKDYRQIEDVFKKGKVNMVI